ncbi:hypothetical protein DFH01_26660 [Falsiroseomonas bella]|uniref:Uncharacterized protein n=1 Tax=Falsiroseomonas bella TaxID=2184016 RepID=A0A317F6Q1_9PROT|nr:hypothetical protein [Falsiroseomonas bella]PWS34212.1 hypothetical protein DFH01_26660 [Falsiroseomonas bella]
MAPNPQPGDIRVVAKTQGAEIFETRSGNAEIWTGTAWRALNALVQIAEHPPKATVRVSRRDLQGLPYPTGVVTVVSGVDGWQQGSATVS